MFDTSNVIIYSHCSCLKDPRRAEQSIQTQIKNCRDFAVEHCFDVAGVIKSIARKDRKSIDLLLDQLADQKDKVILLTDDLYSISKNTSEMWYFKVQLNKKGHEWYVVGLNGYPNFEIVLNP